MNNDLQAKEYDVITHWCPNFSGDSVEPPLALGINEEYHSKTMGCYHLSIPWAQVICVNTIKRISYLVSKRIKIASCRDNIVILYRKKIYVYRIDHALLNCVSWNINLMWYSKFFNNNTSRCTNLSPSAQNLVIWSLLAVLAHSGFNKIHCSVVNNVYFVFP